ncbi:metal dependent phosphohydrolase [Thermocrinis albus DSM 14484]|uniref:Metal dependent phosphohydrolase n=1 Tax=Thermocrinis albus (strain DSM 14484 / JCM 11386 / HI 11/12) TaxID=638303 RepID=D3SQ99_THEAH|nr:HD domain-containing protein [Thermocrinis albus]ADC89336.1 metal dependent phosphohydrolase [Thermocrinis albus DSM 14484]
MFKEFSDPLYGSIRAFSHELKLIDTPTFQRLRYIKQLGVTYLVFPSAQHTRFEHSLGTMELADRMYRGFGLKDERELQLVRLAGLLHDVGHPPFSHTTEVLLGDRSHEDVGRRKILEGEIYHILRREGFSDEEIKLVCHMAFGKDSVVGGELGADRMDYLMRDAYFCGTSYGFFDRDRILNHLVLLEGKKAVRKSALRAVESFFLGRYFMYLQVYFHRVVRILNIHLLDLLKELIKAGDLNKEDLENLTDAHLLTLILKDPNRPSVRRLFNREHYREVVSTEDEDYFEAVKKRLLERYPEEKLRFDIAHKKPLDHNLWIEDEGKCRSLTELSYLVSHLRDIKIMRVYADPSIKNDVEEFIKKIL